MPAKQTPHRVVILGAGIGGLRVAVELEKRCARMKGCEITIIDRNSVHVYWPLLYEVCTGALEEKRGKEVWDLRAGASIQFDAYMTILRGKNAQFVYGHVEGLDKKTKEVMLEGGKRIPYDDVVIALGSETATYGIPGVAEHAIPMKPLKEALKIRKRLAEFLAAYREGKEKRISVCVGGAGATGTEFSAELGNFFLRLVDEGVLKREDYDVTLIEAGPDILGPYSPKFRARAKERLQQLGVEVMTNTKILGIDDGVIRLGYPDGAERPREADVVVWAGGIKPIEVVKRLGAPLDDKGQIVIESTFEVKDMEHAYALGDCAAVLHPKTGKRVPALGQAAEREAAIVAENIVRHLERKGLVAWTPPDRWITVVPMGGKFAMADFGTWYVSGVVGYAIRKLADLYYFLSIMPWSNAWKIWMRGASVYTRND